MGHSQTLERDRTEEEFEETVVRRPSAPTSEQLSLPSIPPAAATRSPLFTSPKRRFAGFTYGQILAGAIVLATAIWGMWATSKIFALEDRRVVSVRLAAIVNNFVTAEARSGTPPEQLAPRTKAFMTALDAVLKARAADGQVVLVGEAVVASSVPDVTNEVVADLGKIVKLAAPAAMPPALAPIEPQSALGPSSGTSTLAPPGTDPAAANPFGIPSQPVPMVPQP